MIQSVANFNRLAQFKILKFLFLWFQKFSVLNQTCQQIVLIQYEHVDLVETFQNLTKWGDIELYKSDGIVVRQNIDFVNLEPVISVEFVIDELREKIEDLKYRWGEKTRVWIFNAFVLHWYNRQKGWRDA